MQLDKIKHHVHACQHVHARSIVSLDKDCIFWVICTSYMHFVYEIVNILHFHDEHNFSYEQNDIFFFIPPVGDFLKIKEFLHLTTTMECKSFQNIQLCFFSKLSKCQSGIKIIKYVKQLNNFFLIIHNNIGNNNYFRI